MNFVKFMTNSILDEISMVEKYKVGLVLVKNTYEDSIKSLDNGTADAYEIEDNIRIICQIYNQIIINEHSDEEEVKFRDELINYINIIKPKLYKFLNMKAFW